VQDSDYTPPGDAPTDTIRARRFNGSHEALVRAVTVMELESLMGRYFRLKQELSIAYRAHPWHAKMIDRLAADIAATEREIGALQSASLGSAVGVVETPAPG
jgi:hypothetical protein